MNTHKNWLQIRTGASKGGPSLSRTGIGERSQLYELNFAGANLIAWVQVRPSGNNWQVVVGNISENWIRVRGGRLKPGEEKTYTFSNQKPSAKISITLSQTRKAVLVSTRPA